MPHTRSIDLRNLGWAIVAVLGLAQFLAVVFYTASNYPETYIWHRHFLSDLGRRRTIGGFDNTFNSELFANSTIVLGASLIPFLLVFPAGFRRGKLLLRILAVVTVIGLIGIGQTPYDLYFVAHHVALFAWIVPMMIMTFTLPILLMVNKQGSSTPLLVVSGILLLATLTYAGMGSRTGFVVMQKIVVFASLVWFVMLVSTVIVVTKWTLSERQQLLAQQADWYATKLGRRRK